MNSKRIDRGQIRFMTLDDFIEKKSFVRVVDLFVEALDLKSVGIKEKEPARTGRPRSAEEKDLLKLIIYGARNQLDSCRDMERACRKDIEVMWLMNGLKPKHSVISAFDKENLEHMHEVFYAFTDLILLETQIGFQSVDGSKYKASNSKDSNFTRFKLDDRIKWKVENIQDSERRIREIDANYDAPEVTVIPYSPKKVQKKQKGEPEEEEEKKNGKQISIWDLLELYDELDETVKEDDEAEAEEYVEAPEIVIQDKQQDSEEKADKPSELDDESKRKLELMKESLEKKREILGKYLGYRQYMEENGLSQLSLTDPDAKLMKSKNGYIVAYNIQASIDSKTHLITEYLPTKDPGDCGQLYSIMSPLKRRYSEGILDLVADKGYQSSADMAQCLENGILPHVILDNGQDYYEVEFKYVPCSVSNEEKEKTDAETLKRCLQAGIVPTAYANNLTFERIYTRKYYENEIDPSSQTGEMTEKQMKELASRGYFVRDLSTGRVYCPQKEVLRKKCEKKDGAIRYANKLACKKCSAKKSGYCTTSEVKEIDFPDKKRIVKCKNWPEVEYEEENASESSQESASKEGEKEEKNSKTAKKVEFEIPKIKRKLVRQEERVVMHLKPDGEKMKERFNLSEHPFGTIKITLRREAFNKRGLPKIDGEFGLSALSYNMLRAYNLFGYEKLVRIIAEAYKHDSRYRSFSKEELKRLKVLEYFEN
ncbi:MAG: transposase [Butyrivibrio sp.]|nr:transposase [Butyrivibrio sp.]